MAKPRLNRAKAFEANSLFHLGEVGFGGNCAAIAAGFSQEMIPIKPLHQILNVRYLFQLTQHERPEVALRPVLYGSPRAFPV
jgi:hypothetical protein